VRRIAALVLAAAVLAPATAADAAGWHRWKGRAGTVAEHGVISRHEAIFNDELFDDYGANVDGFESMGPDPLVLVTGPHVDPANPTQPSFAPSGQVGRFRHTGDFSYPPDEANDDPSDPVDEVHRYTNVADFAEVRVTVKGPTVHLRFAFTALTPEDTTVVGVAIRSGDGPGGAWPFGARLASGGWDRHLTVWGSGGVLTTAGGQPRSLSALGGRVRKNAVANTIDVRLPRSALGPRKRWRLLAAAGRWDAAGLQWAEPEPTDTQSTSPGALGTAPRAYDLAFNQNEPNSLWKDTAQANALDARALDAHAWTISLPRLRSSRSTRIPCAPGPRIERFRSRMGGGSSWRTDEGLISQPQSGHSLNYEFLWHVQPLSFVLPPSACSKSAPTPSMDYFFHPANTNHNAWAVGIQGSHEGRSYLLDPASGYGYVNELATRYNRILASGMSKGEGWNYGDAPGEEQADDDAFRAAARRYRHDPDRVRAVGMSGRLGALFFAETWPDRISHIVSVSYHDAVSPRLANLRNTPWVFMHGTAGLDYDGALAYRSLDDRLSELGYPYAHLTWHGRGHDFTLLDRSYAISDAWTRAPRIRPGRITYHLDPADKRPGVPLFGGVDWVRRAKLADPAKAGTLDLISHRRVGRLPAFETRFAGQFTNAATADVLEINGTSYDSEETVRSRMPDAVEPGWTVDRLSIESTAARRPTRANAVSGTVEGISSVTLDARRAGLSMRRRIDTSGLTTTAPLMLVVRRGGRFRRISIPPG
jgi:hypothetical protein